MGRKIKNEEDYDVTQMMGWLMPWKEKTRDDRSIDDWQETLSIVMMEKLLDLWLSPESRERIKKMMAYYQPLDRAAMAYALLVFAMTGHKMVFKSAVATEHFRLACGLLLQDMPELMFLGHLQGLIKTYVNG